MLADMMVLAPSELRADLQQFYHMNIDDMGDGFSVLHVAICAAYLPHEARVWPALRSIAEKQESQRERERSAKFSLGRDEYERVLKESIWKEA